MSRFWHFSSCSFSSPCHPRRPIQGDTVTFGAEIIHQNDLLEEVRWRPVEHAVHGAEKCGPHLIHETENHTGGGQVIVDHILRTPGRKTDRERQFSSAVTAVGEGQGAEVWTHVSGLVSGMARSTGIWSLR